MSTFSASFLPPRFRRACPQLTAAVNYWCIWQCWIVCTPSIRRATHRDDLLKYRQDLNDAFAAKHLPLREIHELAAMIRRRAVDEQLADIKHHTERETASQLALISGQFDQANVVRFPKRA